MDESTFCFRIDRPKMDFRIWLKGNVLWKSKKVTYLPLPWLWRMIGYSSMMVLRQFGITQFIPTTDFFKEDNFDYEDANSEEKVTELSNA